MSVDIYLNFKGNCRQAVKFYAEVFGTEQPKIMTFGEVPPNPEYPLPEEVKDWVMHTRLNVYGRNMMFSDVFPNMPFVEGNNFSLSLVLDSEDEIKALFDKLKEGGNVQMELQETFWSKLYGSLTDKFGIQWQFNLGMGEW
ncbi:VOC family protein [Bacillus horti]|uniref:PhnB protein n=1 Tax=Caldalkalibacillus horti TaxID=77523 RepID=A0ABT9VYF2_9BACI|nr:VOC family protein [Bacillus horti]MDQ0166008.1 PhnB protein [Bacillus horti]